MSKFRYDVFISYNSKDKLKVRWLAKRLRDAQVRVWFDEWVLKPGEDVYSSIEKGLEESQHLILCISQNALGSGWVALEQSTLMFRKPSQSGRQFIPLLFDNCLRVPNYLRKGFIDFREDEDTACAQLLIRLKLNKSIQQIKSNIDEKPEVDIWSHLLPKEAKEALASQSNKLLFHSNSRFTPIKIFINYVLADKDVAEAVDQWLRLKGLLTKLDKRELFAGSKLREEVFRTIRHYDLVLIFYSQKSQNKPLTEFEYEPNDDLWKLEKISNNNSQKIIYIIVDGTTLPPALATNGLVVMAKGKRFEHVCNEIYSLILKSSKKPTTIDLQRWSDYKF
jgi:hypothetical protein